LAGSSIFDKTANVAVTKKGNQAYSLIYKIRNTI
jgi:hypothetical protein